MNSIGSISHVIAFIAFVGLTLMLIVSRQQNERSGSLMLAGTASAVWALIAAVQATNPILFWAFGGVMDSVRILAWAYFLHSVLDSSSQKVRHPNEEPALQPVTHLHKITLARARFPLFLACIIAAHLGLWWAAAYGVILLQTSAKVMVALWMLSCLIALVCLERFIRSTPPTRRPAIRYLTIGLGAMFLFDFIVFTDTQLFSRINTNLWFARGIAYALVVPLIALAIVRNPQWSVTLHLSRQAVTYSMTALACGGYLIVTAIAAYFVRFSGLEWAGVAEVVVVLVALIILAVLMLSRRLRSGMRVFVSKHLFNFKYDYRLEWLNFTNTLASHIADTPAAVLQALSGLVNSDGGLIWRNSGSGRMELIASHGKLNAADISDHDAICMQEFMINTQWLIDLDELRAHPGRYDKLCVSDELLNNHKAWLVVPLMFQEELVACLLVQRSNVQRDINWEDRDLLKTAGRQAATLLKHEQTQARLSEASQFQAFSKLSTYIVHDLKNIIGQQSLLVSNAVRHKHNPEFVDDVISTVDNSVKRMQALLVQLRANRTDEQMCDVDVGHTLEQVVAIRAHRAPVPVMESCTAQLLVQADPERLKRVFGHLVQNAQEATPADGTVGIRIETLQGMATVTVRDSGCGMTQQFITNSLFKAFESTKGLTGMGIGAFESREYVNSLGGDITVSSKPGHGSEFCVRLPLVNDADRSQLTLNA